MRRLKAFFFSFLFFLRVERELYFLFSLCSVLEPIISFLRPYGIYSLHLVVQNLSATHTQNNITIPDSFQISLYVCAIVYVL